MAFFFFTPHNILKVPSHCAMHHCFLPFYVQILFHCMDRSHSSVDGHWDCFQLLAILNYAAVGIMYKFSCRHMFSSYGIHFNPLNEEFSKTYSVQLCVHRQDSVRTHLLSAWQLSLCSSTVDVPVAFCWQTTNKYLTTLNLYFCLLQSSSSSCSAIFCETG